MSHEPSRNRYVSVYPHFDENEALTPPEQFWPKSTELEKMRKATEAQIKLAEWRIEVRERLRNAESLTD